MEQVPMNAKPKKTRKQNPVSGRIARDVYEHETRLYFESIGTPPKLFIEVQKIAKPFVYLDLKNLVVLLIFETFGLDKWVDLYIVSKSTSRPETSVQTDKACLLRLKSSTLFQETTRFFNCGSSISNEDQSFDALYNSSRKHPSISVAEKNLIISGLSSVIRFTFKYVSYMIGESNLDNPSDAQVDLLGKFKQFLGFRGGCLQACAESSVWTKFCEIDMISAVSEITSVLESRCKAVDTSADLNSTNKVSLELKIPESLVRFEHHLSLPVKIHNYRKIVQDIRKNETTPPELSQTDELCKGVDNILITDLKHEYAEGPTLLLSDLILYPSVHACMLILGREVFSKLLPISSKWYDKVLEHLPVQADVDFSCSLPANYTDLSIIWTTPEVPIQSLYSKDPNRYKPTLRQFTRQHEIDEALELLHSQGIMPLEVSEQNPEFDWSNIPLLAHPEGGNLPESRISRKCSQLANMAHYALKVIHSKKQQQRNSDPSKPFRVVDFCSGGGHLGILMAWLMREEDDYSQCEFVLIENKDESLRRAQIRVQGLGLSNFIFYQSNVDYFEGEFDLGMALHACGTATDLVLSKCIGANASFVCCPCCYGAMQENHVLNYPRSSSFMRVKIPLRHYLVLCHASDHTHDEANEKTNQGKQCMTIIDTDRCLHAQDNSYDVKLCKIVPETASPKNHILVGISSDK